MNSTTVLLISLLLVYSLNFISLMGGSKVIEVPRDYSSIQVAIDEANPGDAIQVAAGTYFESLKITKPLSLIGAGPDNTVIIGKGTVVFVNADNVEIRGFSVRNGTYGIFLWYSSGVLLRNNFMSDNKWNFGVWGNSSSHFVQDVDSSNIVDGKPIYFWVNENGKQVPKDAGYVALVNSINIAVEDINLTSNEQGVLLVDTRYSVIKNVTMSGNDEGIVLRESSNNTIILNSLTSLNWHAIYSLSSHNNTFVENTIRNGTYGISMENSSRNTFYHNNFIYNKQQVYQVNSFNKWDNGKEGNYWSDYKGTDTNGDGIGDTQTPHLGVDYHPLISVFDKTPPIADAGRNQTVFKNTAVFFDAHGSSDNVDIVGYKWDFGDGSNGTGIATNHLYTATGVYTVTLTVADVSGNTATDTTVITVVDPPVVVSWWMFFVVIGAVAIILVALIWLRKSAWIKGIKNKR